MLDFYTVDEQYVDYLRMGEINVHGNSHVPQVSYGPSRNEKFMCGILLQIGELIYLAPVSSYKIQQKNNVLLFDRKGNATSSVRLNFMFPIYQEFVARLVINNVVDPGYKRLLQQEFVSVNSQEDAIRKMALSTYRVVTELIKSGMAVNWACDFVLLECLAHKYKENLEHNEET
ncbi:MAG: type III toxin-antitoxin system ToxN/AbiQ family toxin [Clostridia bacterium]|nr:type III toxin-antitoxin system ToxN/AbiQ family toxin [Clostridia bacterium]